MRTQFLILPGVIGAALALPLLASGYVVTLFNYIYLASIVTLGLVLLTGVTGLISFGQAAFVGLGAYVSAYLGVAYGLSPWLGLAAALAVTASAAYVIGAITLRMSGHYLALGTLAWGISLYYLFGNLGMLGGFNGLSGIPPIRIGSFAFQTEMSMYYLILVLLLLCVWMSRNLMDSRVGRAIRSIRFGPVVAESFGAATPQLKLSVFILAGLFAALSGWLYAHMQRFINPTPFSINTGIEYLFMAVVGGAAHIWGAIVGTVIITVLKQWLQAALPALFGQTGNFEVIVFGALMLVVLHRAKQGLWPSISKYLPAPPPRPLGAVALPGRRRMPEKGECVLQVQSVRKQFGGLVAVKDVSFSVMAGEIVGLLGPNGAGKSTTFNLVSGLLPATSGEVRFLGEPIVGLAMRDIIERGMARTFQHVKLVPTMTLAENVALGAYLRGRASIWRAALRLDRAEEKRLLEDAAYQLQRVGLSGKVHELAANLPLGQQRILEIARALAANPVLLLLDEPAAGLRYLEKKALSELLLQLRQEGVTILLVEHDMDFIMGLADRLVFMEFGEKIADGEPAQMQTHPRVLAAYLGSEA